MDKFAALTIFQAVALTGGFSKAGQRLGLSTSSVTRTVSALERALGTALVTRSTRRIALTAAGQAYADQVTSILRDLRQADDSVTDSGAQAAGTLRVSVPATYSRLRLAPLVPRYMAAYPAVALEIDDSDRYIDLSTERIDVAIRIGTSNRDPRLVARHLADSPRFIVASPEYLRRAGVPQTPADLAAHACLRFAYEAASRMTRQNWTFITGQNETVVGVSGALIANNLDLLFAATLAASGIALLPEWLVASDVAAGTLVRLFDGYEALPPVGRASVYAAFLPDRRNALKVRTFLTFLEENLLSSGHAAAL